MRSTFFTSTSSASEVKQSNYVLPHIKCTFLVYDKERHIQKPGIIHVFANPAKEKAACRSHETLSSMAL